MGEKNRKLASGADLDGETRAEAERLALASEADQRQVIAIHRATANDRKASKEDRAFARRRADALEKLLDLMGEGDD